VTIRWKTYPGITLKETPKDRSKDGWNSMLNQPRICEGCGERLIITGRDALWFSTFHKTSWHFRCKLYRESQG